MVTLISPSENLPIFAEHRGNAKLSAISCANALFELPASKQMSEKDRCV